MGFAAVAVLLSLLAMQGAPQARASPDPLRLVTKHFKGSITIKQQGHALEFCPDNTCDGFESTRTVRIATLRDFAYLYIYYFSTFVYLPEWRTDPDARKGAEAVLAKPEYSACRNEQAIAAARCVLLDLSRGDRIRLIFVRYDERQRNVVRMDLRKELTQE